MRYITNWAEMSEAEKAQTQQVIARRNEKRLRRLRGGASISQGTYLFNGFECAFRRKAASPGFEAKPPLILIHPIGIGLASWFFNRLVDRWAGAELFVPDLIGCGASQAWDPAERGLHVPLDYVRQMQQLWREEVRRPCIVVSQGGVAPLAVELACIESDTWRGSRAVRGVVLLSPPELELLADGLDETEVKRNFELLSRTLGARSALGTWAYQALSSRVFIDFFSRQFLFATATAETCAAFEEFVDECVDETDPTKRWPILAFNAGLVGLRGLREEMRNLRQPLLVLIGSDGGKPLSNDGLGYQALLPRCKLLRIPAAKNVLPWEEAGATSEAIGEFCEADVSFSGIRWPPEE